MRKRRKVEVGGTIDGVADECEKKKKENFLAMNGMLSPTLFGI